VHLPPGGERSTYVLDAPALLAYLEGQAGGAQVRDLLARSAEGFQFYVSLVTLAEVATAVEQQAGGLYAERALSTLRALPITLVGVDQPLAQAAARVAARFPISLAVAFAVALAQRVGAALVTRDPHLNQVRLLVPLVQIG